jgi:hypothetical protein
MEGGFVEGVELLRLTGNRRLGLGLETHPRLEPQVCLFYLRLNVL